MTLAGFSVLSEADMLTQVTARTQVMAATFCSRALGQAAVCFLADLSAHMSLRSMTKYLQMLTLLESYGHPCGQASLRARED